jgi:tRNA pseudouridine38-40 synthase
MNVKLTIEYDGTNYHGWQIQPNGKTIQEILEQAIEKVLGVNARLNGSGRTDAGVHALGQVANFVSPRDIDPLRLQTGLNAVTPADIVVTQVEVVRDAFDARRDPRSRKYEYRIWNHRSPSPFHGRYSWHIPYSLNLLAMQDAIKCLEGEHDFASFQAAGCDAEHAVRRIFANSLVEKDGMLVYAVEATAYLRHMVRNIVGTLVGVGSGERAPEAFVELLTARDRRLAGPTAPAQGLFLVEVKY